MMQNEVYDLLIIGSGPAGMGAAVYAVRAGLKAAVVDRSPVSGGQVQSTYEVDNYLGLPGLSGGDLSDRFREHADRLGAVFITAQVQAIDRTEDRQSGYTVRTDQGAYQTRSVILATGASHSLLGVPGETEFAGLGVSYCATCDGAFYRKRTVAVVGGGDVAVEDAIFLAGICKKVYLVHRRDQLRAADSLQKKLFSCGNAEVLWNCEVKEITGQETVENILIYNNKSGEQSRLDVEGVFIAVGIVPDTAVCRGLVEMDEKGYVIAGETCVTSEEGIFAAGDIRKKPMRQIITAVADGANAVHSAQEYLRNRR